MAIEGFKEIIDRKGYKVDSEDRKVFEKEISKSNFGLGCSDMIEFILFDSSENQLPQGDDGKLVRYIYIDDANISEYFILSDNPQTKKKNGTTEFIVDIEKLIREAGYSNGIFKTQVTLLNRRAGVEGVEGDNLWIHEISPSRTEIRVLPNRAKKKNKDLEERLSIFLENGTFRDDVIYYVSVFIEGLNLEEIVQSFLFSKGTEKDGVEYINLIKKEFNVESFEILINRIKTKFIESMKYYSARRNWKINDINYGKPLGDKDDCIDLSIPQLQQDAQQSLINCIDYYLPKRDIQKDNILSKEEQITMDKVSQILKSVTSNSLFKSSVPDKVNARVRGCTDPKATNYNSLAQDNDGSCTYKKIIPPLDLVVDEEEIPEEEPEIKGCTNPKAINFNKYATKDDGSCKYKDVIHRVTKKYYIWSKKGSIKWKDGGTNQIVKGKMYDSFTITHDIGKIKWGIFDDVRNTPKPNVLPTTYKYLITNSNNYKLITPKLLNVNEYGDRFIFDDVGDKIVKSGQRVPYPNPYYDFKQKTSLTVTYKDAIGNTKTSSNLLPGDTTTICAQKGTVSKMPGITIIQQGICTVGFKTIGTDGIIPPNPIKKNWKIKDKIVEVLEDIIVPKPEVKIQPIPKPEPIPVPVKIYSVPAPPVPAPVVIPIAQVGSTTGGGQTSGEMLEQEQEYESDASVLVNYGGSVLGGGDIVIKKNRPPRER